MNARAAPGPARQKNPPYPPAPGNPLVARNPQKYMDNYKLATTADFQKATQRVYYGGKTGSMIVLPIMKR